MALIVQACGEWPRLDVPPEPRPALFLDRDGVLNIDHGYVFRIEDFQWVPGALDLLAWARAAGYWTVVVTNQSGIGRGMYGQSEFHALCQWMVSAVPIDMIAYCPHTPEDRCPSRKPGTGMLEAADRLLGVVKGESILVGDKQTDIQAAASFGVPSMLFEGGNVWEAFQNRPV